MHISLKLSRSSQFKSSIYLSHNQIACARYNLKITQANIIGGIFDNIFYRAKHLLKEVTLVNCEQHIITNICTLN